VTAAGAPPLLYAWRRNGVAIGGATGPTYTIDVATASEAGSEFSCHVQNAYGSVLSSNAVLDFNSETLEVLNGGFETGDFTDWGLLGNTAGSLVSDFPYTHSGNYAAQMGPVTTLGYLTQFVPTALKSSYLVSCWLYCDGETPNEFQLSWNGRKLVDKLNLPFLGWTNIQVVAPVTLTNTLLEFGFRDDPSAFSFDDVAVYQINPLIETAASANGGIEFMWTPLTNYSYQAQFKTNLLQTNWVNLGAPIKFPPFSVSPGGGGAGTNSQEFYRLLVVP
jgi:hypothetical protein